MFILDPFSYNLKVPKLRHVPKRFECKFISTICIKAQSQPCESRKALRKQWDGFGFQEQIQASEIRKWLARNAQKALQLNEFDLLTVTHLSYEI